MRAASLRSASTAAAALLALMLMASAARGGDDLHALVREGQRLYASGQVGEAQEKFAAAELLAPEDAHVAYNRARAYQAAGELEKAEEYYRKASLTLDAELAPRITFNRGALEVAKAEALLGEDPTAVRGEEREKVLGLFQSAVRHYRGVAEWGADDRDARYNIELVRVFVKDLRDRWRKADREKAREETNLLRYLEYLMGQEEILQEATAAIESNRTDQRHAVRLEQIRIIQGELVDEMPHLREKVKTWVAKAGAAPAAPGGAAPSPDPKKAEMLQQAEKHLLDLVDRVETGMETAVRALAAIKLAAAQTAERAAHDALLDMWKGLADLGSLLRRAIQGQDGVVERAASAAEDASGLDEKAVKDLSGRLVTDQRRVRDLVPLMEGRARAMLKQLASAPAGQGGGSGGAAAGGQDPAKMKQALDKALALLPQADEAMDNAAASFEERAWPAGHEKAEAAAKVLREIAKLLQDQQKQDQKQNQKQDQQQQEQEQQEQQKDDGQKQDQQEQDQQQREQQKKMSREQAEQQLRKMRESRNKREKRRREVAGVRRIRVEKDW